MTTNQHGNRSFVYILKFYEQINLADFEYMDFMNSDKVRSIFIIYQLLILMKILVRILHQGRSLMIIIATIVILISTSNPLYYMS